MVTPMRQYPLQQYYLLGSLREPSEYWCGAYFCSLDTRREAILRTERNQSLHTAC